MLLSTLHVHNSSLVGIDIQVTSHIGQETLISPLPIAKYGTSGHKVSTEKEKHLISTRNKERYVKALKF